MPPSNTSRIAKNTLLLYFRQILIMLVSLYTVRVVLNVLGAEDYGIYNVVAGVVTMFGFLSSAMATASQRYFAFDLGKEDYEHLKTTFSVTFQIYVLLAAIIVVLAETIGLWFVMNKLVIPPERLTAAIWIYQAAVFSFLLTLITTPYMACIIAHENMNIYAYVSIVEALLKLAIVFLLQVLDSDKLVWYGLLLAIVAFINTSIYRTYCRKKYAECKFQYIKDKDLFKELVSYSGWNLFGAGVGIVKGQALNILLNIYFGVVVNAARAISSQVSAAVTSFSQNFNTALRPPIIKSYAVGDKTETLKLVWQGCKYTFFLMYIISLPLILEMSTILQIWLDNIPSYAVIFTQLEFIIVLVNSASVPIMTLAHATGKIKLYQGLTGGLQLLIIPVAIFFLELHSPAYSVLLVTLAFTMLSFFVRLIIVKHLVKFKLFDFVKYVIYPCFKVICPTAGITLLYYLNSEQTITRMIITTLLSVVSIIICVIYLGMNVNERQVLLSKIKKYHVKN